MASFPGDPRGPISLAAERARVRQFSSGSRLRLIGSLWLMWLTHVYRCQTEGLAAATPNCINQKESITALERDYPKGWDCCETHKALKEEREQIAALAEELNKTAAPHQTTDTLSRGWWFRFGYRCPQSVIL